MPSPSSVCAQRASRLNGDQASQCALLVQRKPRTLGFANPLCRPPRAPRELMLPPLPRPWPTPPLFEAVPRAWRLSDPPGRGGCLEAAGLSTNVVSVVLRGAQVGIVRGGGCRWEFLRHIHRAKRRSMLPYVHKGGLCVMFCRPFRHTDIWNALGFSLLCAAEGLGDRSLWKINAESVHIEAVEKAGKRLAET
jgi:hypothetical protein